jgi:hypothetical protein
LRFGDIVEIPTKSGYAYVQYTHRIPQWGALIRVLPGIYKRRPADLKKLADRPERFVTFFPVTIAVHRKIFKVVGHSEVPESAKKLPLFRAAGFIDRAGKVHDWWLWDGEKSWRVGVLTDDLRRLPIKAVMNDTALISRIEKRWIPEKDKR